MMAGRIGLTLVVAMVAVAVSSHLWAEPLLQRLITGL